MFDKAAAVQLLEAAAVESRKIIRDPAETSAEEFIAAVAEYLTSTADGYSRETYAEIAFAYWQGRQDSEIVHRTVRAAVSTAIRAAGLSI